MRYAVRMVRLRPRPSRTGLLSPEETHARHHHRERSHHRRRRLGGAEGESRRAPPRRRRADQEVPRVSSRSGSRRARSCTASTPGSASSRKSSSPTNRSSSSSATSSTTTRRASASRRPIDHVRAAMLLRANVLAMGYSGCRPEIAFTFVEMLNKGVTPVVCDEGIRRRVRGPRPDEPDRAPHDGRGRGVLRGQADARGRGSRKGRDPGAGSPGARRARVDQRLEPHERDRVSRRVRRGEMAPPGGDRRGDDARGAQGEPQALRHAAPRAPRFSRRGHLGVEHTKDDRGIRPHDRQREGQGAGRVQHALDAAGDRGRPRPSALDEKPARDRGERRRRQSRSFSRTTGGSHRRELPGLADQSSPRHARRRGHHGLRALRADG